MSVYHVAEGETLLITGPAKVDLVSDIAPVIGGSPSGGGGAGHAPVTTSLSPASAVAGDAEDIQLVVNGSGFNEISKIVFGGNDEPTTLLSPNQVRTIVKPSLFAPDDAVPVAVRNGSLVSNEQSFAFTASARGGKHKRS